MGVACTGCVSISPSLDNTRQSLHRLPTFDSLGHNLSEVAVILFSSGTTGPSKGVMMSDRFLQYQFIMMM